jgi:hypothetical protein
MPSEDTAALEPYLLASDDLGGFTVQESGQVGGASVGHLCPQTTVSFDEFGAVRVSLTSLAGGGEVGIEEYLWTGDRAELDAMMADLKTAVSDCDGTEWDYYGEQIALEAIDAPAVGDAQVAVRQSGPTTDDVFEVLRVYIRVSETMAIIEISERRDSASTQPTVDVATFDDIVTAAIDKLPS